MELFVLYKAGAVHVEVKTVNTNSEAFKKIFLGAQPPLMEEKEKDAIYSDNEEIEGRIFHLSQEFNVPLFEKDAVVEKSIENLYRNFKFFMKKKADHDKGKRHPSLIASLPEPIALLHKKFVEHLAKINQLMCERKSRYLVGEVITQYDCELMPRLHHMRIAGERLLGFEISHELIYLWNYIWTAYKTDSFNESCPCDQDIIYHYKEQLNVVTNLRETLQTPTKTQTIPQDIINEIDRLDCKNRLRNNSEDVS
uniref:Chloride intracellular channel n=1 Tax=Ditylenchus dipsaci TaxID=166011 RepID=A0A915EJY9_9BILA